jgi:hypothetical protein
MFTPTTVSLVPTPVYTFRVDQKKSLVFVRPGEIPRKAKV